MAATLSLLSTLALQAGGSREAHAADQKFAMAMMHFNVQYVAGGMVGFWPKPDARLDLSAEQIEDQIIVESFAPIVDLFGKHPTWSTNVEMQGYMLDVIGTRHPALLEKLKTLATAGRLEVVSFHYSDQLFIAHAPEDWERSADLTRATFAKWGVPLGTAVFCQEGQAGLGMAAAMKKHGYGVMVWPKNLFSYQHGDAADDAPLYAFGEISMVTSRGGKFDVGAGNTVETTWTFVDDGELLATGGTGPYTPDVFHTKVSAVAAYEEKLSALETAGFQIVAVGKYVEAVKATVKPKTPPPLLDGTWQPGSTDGVRKWLGGGGLHTDDERDNDMRTLAALAHRELVAANVAATKAGIDAKADIDGGFRLLALGEVSDATGINPFRGEAEYGIAHCSEALRIAREVIRRAKTALGASTIAIDASVGTVTAGAKPAAPGTPIDAPTTTAITVEPGDRTFKTEWSQLPTGRKVVSVSFGKGDYNGRQISVTFTGSKGFDIAYTPALTDVPVHHKRDDFSFEHYMLALHDGLLGLAQPVGARGPRLRSPRGEDRPHQRQRGVQGRHRQSRRRNSLGVPPRRR